MVGPAEEGKNILAHPLILEPEPVGLAAKVNPGDLLNGGRVVHRWAPGLLAMGCRFYPNIFRRMTSFFRFQRARTPRSGRRRPMMLCERCRVRLERARL